MAVGPYWVGDKPNEALSLAVVRGGLPVDLSIYTSATVTLTGPDDLAIDTAGVTATLATDRVVVAWPPDHSLFSVPGPYTLQVRLTADSGASDMAFPVEFWVNSPEPHADAAWADRRDVLTYTGVSVDAPTLMQAQGMIELLVGTSYAATWDDTLNRSRMKTKNRRLLKMAVAYQAAYLAQHEGVFSRSAVASMSQDGVSASVGDDTDGWVLAPLAKRALSQVSWRGDRTIRVGPQRRGGSLAALQDAWVRDEAGVTIWQPVGTTGRFRGHRDPYLPPGTTEYGV